MKNVLILHGTEGNPEENWFPWLKDSLEKEGIPTEIPQLEKSDLPNKNTWLTQASSFDTGPETVVIGHSLGSVLILRMLERGHRFKAAFLVAPFLEDLGWDVLKDSLFFVESFEWDKIKDRCGHFEVFSSKNDPHLTTDHSEVVSKNLEVPNIVMDVEKHFNMTEFPVLLERIILQK